MENLATQEVQETPEVQRHSFFDSKEHYLQFKAAWKKYISDGHHLCGTYTDNQGGTCKYASNLTTIHHLIYNGLRKRDLRKSFCPITKPQKLKLAGGDPYAAFNYARNMLRYYARRGSTSAISDVFGDTVTTSMLSELSESLEDVKM
jgi:hypothetical protein